MNIGSIITVLKMTGLKTYIASIGSIAQGVYLITEDQYMEGWALINVGLTAFGFRAAIAK